MKASHWLVFLVCVLTAAGCASGSQPGGTGDDNDDTAADGGGGAGASGGTGTALVVAEQVSVVDAQDESGAGLVAGLQIASNLKAVALEELPADSDYNTTESHTFVHERSVEAFNTINNIFCILKQSQYDQLVNQGDYIAQIDKTLCDSDSDDPSAAGEASTNESSSSNAPEYILGTFNSYRADDSSPHIVAAWLHFPEDGFEPAQLIMAKLSITEALSDTNPLGIFHMDFEGFPEDDFGPALDHPFFTGYIETEKQEDGSIVLHFYNSGGNGTNFSFTEKVTMTRSEDGSSGSGTTESMMQAPFGDSGEKSFDIAYNDDFFLRDDGSSQVCLSRKEFDDTTWRYSIFDDDDGSLVVRNSGFPIRIPAADGETHDRHGYVGYHGVWIDGNETLDDGTTVYRQNFDSPPEENDQGTPYIYRGVGGKLILHTQKNITLGDICGQPLHSGDCSPEGCTSYQVEWDCEAQKFYKTKSLNEENHLWQDMEPEEVTFDENDWDFSFWSESLGGDGRVKLRGFESEETALTAGGPTEPVFTPPSNATTVVFYLNQTVFPGDIEASLDLICFNECPDPDLVATGDPSPYIAQSSYNTPYEETFGFLAQEVPYTSLVAGEHCAAYSFNADTMLLQYGGTDVVMGDDVDSDFGIWTGALIREEDKSELACDFDPEGRTCPWQAYDHLDSYYTWETGSNPWNRLSYLEDPDTGSIVEFERPLMLEYTHTDGVKYYIEYAGPGEIHLPGKCVDMDAGEDTDCAEAGGKEGIRWVPIISLADGSLVCEVESPESCYYVKGLEKEQRMLAVPVSECTASGLSTSTKELPDGSSSEEPNIGDEPEVDGAPAVIGGVLQ